MEGFSAGIALRKELEASVSFKGISISRSGGAASLPAFGSVWIEVESSNCSLTLREKDGSIISGCSVELKNMAAGLVEKRKTSDAFGICLFSIAYNTPYVIKASGSLYHDAEIFISQPYGRATLHITMNRQQPAVLTKRGMAANARPHDPENILYL